MEIKQLRVNSKKYYTIRDRVEKEKKFNGEKIFKLKTYKMDFGDESDVDIERCLIYVSESKYYLLYQDGSISNILIDSSVLKNRYSNYLFEKGLKKLN